MQLEEKNYFSRELPIREARQLKGDADGGGSSETLSLICIQRHIERPCNSLFCLS